MKLDGLVQSHFSLPWREGIKGRGEITLSDTATYHPHPNPPPSRGRRFWTFYEGIKLTVFLIFMTFFKVPLLWGQEVKQAIEVFPSTPFYQYIIYENLVIFWIAIIGLIVIIGMKLREIERVQKLGLDKTDHLSMRSD